MAGTASNTLCNHTMEVCWLESNKISVQTAPSITLGLVATLNHVPLTALDSHLEFFPCQQLLVFKTQEKLVPSIPRELVGQEGGQPSDTIMHSVQRHSYNALYLEIKRKQWHL